MRLIKRTEIEKPDEVYNLHVNDDHNYIVEGSVVANCHQAKAAALKELLTGVMSRIPIRWGLTGTIPKEKFESTTLYVSIGPLVSQLSASTLQDAGILAQCHVNVVQLQDGVEFRDYQSELKYLLENEARLDTIAALIEKIRTSGNTLVLVDRIAPGETLATKIADSVFVSGNTKLTERKEEYDEVATRSDKVIIATMGVAAVGINLPRIFNLVMIEPGKSYIRTIQSIGRGLRKAEDKDEVTIYDITSSAKFAKRHLAKRKEYYRDAGYPFTIEKLHWK
jgi:superfamily II DNA or RNA helicase